MWNSIQMNIQNLVASKSINHDNIKHCTYWYLIESILLEIKVRDSFTAALSLKYETLHG